MRSMLKQLQLGQRDQALLSFVDAAMKKEESKIVMETHYSQELSLLYILQEDYDRAKYYANNCMQVFMQVSFYTTRIESMYFQICKWNTFVFECYSWFIYQWII